MVQNITQQELDRRRCLARLRRSIIFEKQTRDTAWSAARRERAKRRIEMLYTLVSVVESVAISKLDPAVIEPFISKGL